MTACCRNCAFLLLSLALLLTTCGQPSDSEVVVAYVSVDQIYSEPILREFTRTTGIEVRAVYDVEASKTTGLVNRLIAEADRPRADVYWNGEFVQTMLLKEKGVLAPYAPPAYDEVPAQFRDPDRTWTGMGGRVRVLLTRPEAPPVTGLEDLRSESVPAHLVGIAYPLFGSSVTHAAALYASWGADKAKAFYADLQARGVRVLDGNAMVRDLVVSGELKVGLTDSDDACGALARGGGVRLVLPDQNAEGTLLIPGTVALIAGAPHPENARQLVDYLTSARSEERLMEAGFCQLSLRPGGPAAECLQSENIRTLSVSPDEVWQGLALSRPDMSQIFVR